MLWLGTHFTLRHLLRWPFNVKYNLSSFTLEWTSVIAKPLHRACCGQHRKIFPFFYAPGIFGLEIIILYYILFKVLLPVLQPAQMLGTEPGDKASIFNVVTPKGIGNTGHVNVHFQSRRPCERLFIVKMRRGHESDATF